MKSILYPLKSTSRSRRSIEEIPKGIELLLKAIEEHHTEYDNNPKNSKNKILENITSYKQVLSCDYS